jgi:hypothetical protein
MVMKLNYKVKGKSGKPKAKKASGCGGWEQVGNCFVF